MKILITHIILNRINSWTWLPLNSLKPIWLYWNPKPEELPWESTIPFLTVLTGDHKVSWTLSRIKVLVVHAGLSPLLVPLNLCLLSRRDNSQTSLNNNWLTAQRVTETMDATEVWWPMAFNISEIMVLWTNLNILTLVEMVHARLRITKIQKFQDMLKFLIVVLYLQK